MTALADKRMLQPKSVKMLSLTLKSGKKGYQGARACLNTSDGKCYPAAVGTTFVPVGFFESTVDAASGDTAAKVRLDAELSAYWFANDTVSPVGSANVGGTCYLLDDQTVTADSTGASKAGMVLQVDSVQGVLVAAGPSVTGPAGADGTVGAGNVGVSLMSLRECSATGDVLNIAGNGGVLASDTTPILRGDANNSQEISWATGNVDPLVVEIPIPTDLDDTQNVTLALQVYSGTTDAATMGVATSWDGGAEVTDSADDSGTKSASRHEITATIAAADVPVNPKTVTLRLTPPTHATNAIQLCGVQLRYAKG
jgi:hypothetical protein